MARPPSTARLSLGVGDLSLARGYLPVRPSGSRAYRDTSLTVLRGVGVVGPDVVGGRLTGRRSHAEPYADVIVPEVAVGLMVVAYRPTVRVTTAVVSRPRSRG